MNWTVSFFRIVLTSIILFPASNSTIAFGNDADGTSVSHIWKSGKYVYTRASEASTLFIETKFRGREPHFELSESPTAGDSGATPQKWIWKEFDGSKSTTWTAELRKISGADRHFLLTDKEGREHKVLVYPFRDIEQTWVVIHYFPDRDENPIFFATPFSRLPEIEYLDEP